MSQRFITPALFRFLRELKQNNRREWFLANKQRYENDVRPPLLKFIAAFGRHLNRISPRLVADPRPIGGSLLRVYRDTRFSTDKTPYKTMAGLHFRHAGGKDIHAPGYYLHLEPGEVFAGCGLWHPDGETLAKIRAAIVAQPAKWKRVTGARVLKKGTELAGDSLSRPPRGFDPDHPLIEDLKRKDFITVIPFSETQACSPNFLERFTAACKTVAPFMEFLTVATGLRW